MHRCSSGLSLNNVALAMRAEPAPMGSPAASLEPAAAVPATAATAEGGASLLAPFIRPSDDLEVSYAVLLSDLSNTAYDVSQIDAQKLQEVHQLYLVTSSTRWVTGG